MSKTNRPIFASKTAFEALPVDSGEDTEDDVAPVANLPQHTYASSFQTVSSLLTSITRNSPHTHTGTHTKTPSKKHTKATKPETKPTKKSTKSRLAESHPEPVTHLDDEDDDVVLIPPPGTFLNPVHVPDPDLAEQQPSSSSPAHDATESHVKSDPPPPYVNGTKEEDKEKATTTVQPDKPFSEPVTTSSSPNASEPTSLRTKEEPAPQNLSRDRDAELTKKRQNMFTRTLWTFIMIGGFLGESAPPVSFKSHISSCPFAGLLVLGHAYMVILVLICQTLVYREVTALFSLKNRMQGSEVAQTNGKDPWSKTLNWYFFAVTNYFLYGESIIYYFKVNNTSLLLSPVPLTLTHGGNHQHVVFADAQLLPFATNHRILSFTLYIIGFVGFVMSLRKGYLKQQFGLFCWVHMSLLLIVVSRCDLKKFPPLLAR
jgi:phosphatidate cytidylyltransferase